MPLSHAEIERYSRQIIIPAVGAAGQAKLLSSRVLVAGEKSGIRQARRYLEATGVGMTDKDSEAGCVLLAGVRDLTPARLENLAALARPIVWYRIEGSRLLAGAHHPRESWPPPGLVASKRTQGVESDDLLHEVAACDGVGSVVALLLGWSCSAATREVTLA